ncbi:hypothetical protein ACGFXC_06990 [Streptomyces sp. NPDC048507]|uniref:hypothetical protein n=1 Tax=Streptomyces sp. NPDC048507 TaxID=3365560 RepID=UPI0037235F2B
MSGGQTKLAEHPVLIFIGVVATIIGALAAGKDLFGSDDPPSRAADAAPSVSRPASPPGDDGAGAAPTPSPDRTRTAGPDPDAGSGPVPETSEPGDLFPGGDDPAPKAPVVPTVKAQPPGHSGPLVVRIDMGLSGKVGPNTYRARSAPGADTYVQDAGGRLDRGCYVQWTLRRGGDVVQLERSERCRPPSITLFNFDSGSLQQPGSYTLTADVTTDWSQTGSASVTFEVVPK